jgi:hypothetical protein
MISMPKIVNYIFGGEIFRSEKSTVWGRSIKIHPEN